MKNFVLKYNQINESVETSLDDFSIEEIRHLSEIGVINPDLYYIYAYVKDGSRLSLILRNTKLTHIPSWVKIVNGSLDIAQSNIEEIPDDLTITGGITAYDSKLRNFTRNIVGGTLDIANTQVTKLPTGLIVKGSLDVSGLQFEEIPKDLKIYGKSFFIMSSNLEQFSDKELHKMYKISGIIIRR